jgi:uncharacterized surface protein with fasciclin (FAS1) repeats
MSTIFERVRSDSTLKTLADLIGKAGLAGLLGGAAEYTLFAPNDGAFQRMDIEKSLDDPRNLMATLRYHLVSGKLTAAEIGALSTLDTEYGKALTVEPEEGAPLIDNAQFVTTDIECSNGIIHIINNVFQPRLSGWYREDLS